MRILTLALTAVLVFHFHSAHAASPEEEARFLAAAKQAFEKHDADALMVLTCWDRVPDRFKDSGKERYARDVAQTATDIKLTDPDPKYPFLVWKDKDDTSYGSNLTVVKQLKITFTSGTKSHAVYFVGEKDGKLYLLKAAPVK